MLNFSPRKTFYEYKELSFVKMLYLLFLTLQLAINKWPDYFCGVETGIQRTTH